MTRALAFVLALLAGLALPASAQFAPPTTIQHVAVNTNAADFTVVSAVAGRSIRVRRLDAQNVGTGAKVTLQICDGTCGTAANVKFKWDLSAATTNGMGGGWTFHAASRQSEWGLTAGSALIAQVDTGATNNARVSVTYYLE